jgi:hypothetical protein
VKRDLSTVGRTLLSELALLVTAQQGVIYQMHNEEEAMADAAYADLFMSKLDGPHGHV